MKLVKRRPLFTARARHQYPAARAFHLPQREHIKHPMPPRKPKAESDVACS